MGAGVTMGGFLGEVALSQMLSDYKPIVQT